jgi:hypothetical protein
MFFRQVDIDAKFNRIKMSAKEKMELRGIEPRTSHMRSEHSTSELQPLHNPRFRFSGSYLVEFGLLPRDSHLVTIQRVQGRIFSTVHDQSINYIKLNELH